MIKDIIAQLATPLHRQINEMITICVQKYRNAPPLTTSFHLDAIILHLMKSINLQ